MALKTIKGATRESVTRFAGGGGGWAAACPSYVRSGLRVPWAAAGSVTPPVPGPASPLPDLQGATGPRSDHPFTLTGGAWGGLVARPAGPVWPVAWAAGAQAGGLEFSPERQDRLLG